MIDPFEHFAHAGVEVGAGDVYHEYAFQALDDLPQVVFQFKKAVAVVIERAGVAAELA